MITQKKFAVDLVNTSSFDNLTKVITKEGIECFINIKTSMRKADITYSICEGDGKFINFGGLLVNTETLYAVLGYNANSNAYIPLFNMKEIFGVILFGDKNSISNDDALYIIESMKLDFKNFDVVGYVNSTVASLKTGLMSIILNIVTEINRKTNGTKALVGESDFWMLLTSFIGDVLSALDVLGKEFFNNFIAEDDMNEVIGNANQNSAVLNAYGKKSLNTMFLKNVKERGVDPEFIREVSSLGFARNRRNELISNLNRDYRKVFGVLSSNTYVVPKGNTLDINAISDTEISAYNLFDIMRAMNTEQDLFFSYDVMASFKDESLFNMLLNKLKLEGEVNAIGKDKFRDNMINYAKTLVNILDMGSVYSRKVTQDQKNFPVFASKELINAGKIVEKASKRMLSLFK